MPEDVDARISIHEDKKPLIVFMDRPNLPGNLGTLIRSCDAFGVDGVVVFGHAADLYEPQTVRASLGTLFALPFVILGPLTGSLADRVSKTRIIRAANLMEVFVMGSALAAFFFVPNGPFTAMVPRRWNRVVEVS